MQKGPCERQLQSVSSGLTRKAFMSGSAAAATTLFATKGRAGQGLAALLNTSILRPYENAWLYSARAPNGEVRAQGIWSDHLQFKEMDSRRALLRVQGMTYVTGASSSVLNAFDPDTMSPISSQTRGPDGKSIRRTFKDGVVRSVTIAGPRAPEIVSEFSAPEGTLDFYGGMYGLLLVTFPMHYGAKSTFQSVDEFNDVVIPASYEVIGRELVAAGSRGCRRAWKVESNRVGSARMTFWLSPEAPYIIRLEMVNDGSPLVMSFDMI